MQGTDDRPKVGISSCLLGEEVRYDGGHKRNEFVTRSLAEQFQLVPFCPEVAIGLGIPRKPIRLVRTAETDGQVRAVHVDDADNDFTGPLTDYGNKIAAGLGNYCGYIVKKDSPSCGMERVKVYSHNDRPPVRQGSGIFTATIMTARPELPIEEEGRLMDSGIRENFIMRVFTLYRWHQFLDGGMSAADLINFHTRHKFLLLAHHEPAYRALGRLVAQAGDLPMETLTKKYSQQMMDCLKHRATPQKHTNVLMHIMGFIKEQMSADEKQELLGLIEEHRTGQLPLIVPITLLNHFLRRYPNEYIADQVYLEPHPRELMLRNSL